MSDKEPILGEVDIAIDGVTYTLSLPSAAMAKATRMMRSEGIIFPMVRLEASVEWTFEELRAIWWSFFHSHHPKLTPDQTSALFDKLGVVRGFKLVETVIVQAFTGTQDRPLAAAPAAPAEPVAPSKAGAGKT